MATINYKDKYEKAVQAAMLAKQDTESAVTIGILEEIFPELRESEGERIRKELIKETKGSEVRLFETVTNDEFIAWLEKEGEQKPNSCDGCVNRKGCINCEEENMKEALDKVEPNFHEGDWVVWDNKISCHIDNIYQGKESLMYTITDAHNMTRSYSVKGFDNNAHLWTIQDAKDGDVLYSRCCKLLWIYKDEKTYHVGYNLNYNSGSIVINKCVCIPTDVQPATKEQRDTLEKAMTDAGYAFDFEKKELKKIEQNPAENKGMNLVEEEMTPFQKKVFCIIDTSIEEEQGLKQVCEELLALAANEIEQKPDDLKTKAGNWYVCDMEVMNENMVTAFRRGEIYYCPKDGYLDVRGALFEVGFLDVFRLATEKEIPQTKQEWSEEDEKMLKRLCRIVHSQRVEKVITHKH